MATPQAGLGQAANDDPTPEPPQVAEEAFLPLIIRRTPSTKSVFGVEMHRISMQGGLEQVALAETTWVRRNGLLWSLIEMEEGDYDWTSAHIQAIEQELLNAAEEGIEVILIVRSTPPWAQKIPGYYCGPIKEEKLEAFANFMAEAVKRYSIPPYNVKYWQIWNEPDVGYLNEFLPQSPFGCWGDDFDKQYFGGDYFATMLKQVYPKIKEVDASVQVLLGGLLLNCDPEICKQPAPKFLEGVLENDGGDYFDILSFHAYDFYYGSLGKYGNVAWGTRSEDGGPVMIAKINFLKSLLKKYGHEDKQIMNTETALVCGQTGQEGMCLSEEYELTKAYYVPQMFAATIAEGLEASIWYSVRGWRRSGLLDADLTPRYAYDAYTFARAKLINAAYARDISEYWNISGYEFVRFDRRIWIIWTKTGSRTISLPGTPLGIWDALGNPIPVSGSTLVVTAETLYVDWPNP